MTDNKKRDLGANGAEEVGAEEVGAPRDALRISPGKLSGRVRAVASKSDAHRALIAAALADGPTALVFDGTSRDIEATVECLRALGAGLARRQDETVVTPLALKQESAAGRPLLDCGESGSTLRFLLPVAAAIRPQTAFTARPGLAVRPLDRLREAMEKGGASFSAVSLPFTVSGFLRGGRYLLPGNVSSQYISGLLFALPLLEEDSEILLTSPLESAGYVEMTVKTLRAFSINIEEKAGGFAVAGRQVYRSPGRLKLEGDWSNAAFYLAAGALGPGVTVTGLSAGSLQRDRQILDLLREFGAGVSVEGDQVRAWSGALRGVEIDAGQIPDLVPILAVVAAYAAGKTLIRNAGRLRIKESDRLVTVSAMLRGLGAQVAELPDGLIITGRGSLSGGGADSANDHRIAMAAAIAGAYARGETMISGPWAVRKSYPGFYRDFQELGGKVHVL